MKGFSATQLIIIFTTYESVRILIVLVWVDDILIAATSQGFMNKFKDKMKTWFRMKDLMEVPCFLGIDFKPESDEITMNQSRYIILHDRMQAQIHTM